MSWVESWGLVPGLEAGVSAGCRELLSGLSLTCCAEAVWPALRFSSGGNALSAGINLMCCEEVSSGFSYVPALGQKPTCIVLLTSEYLHVCRA